MYTAIVSPNAARAEIFLNGISVDFLAGDEVSQLLDERTEAQTDRLIRYLLSQ